jgi:hypothetical protein
MKHIKQYKIFESDSITVSDKVKECFLPVIDILYDRVKIKTLSKRNPDLVKIKIEFGDISENERDILVEEISDAILHCMGYNLEIVVSNIFYRSHMIGPLMSNKVEFFYNSEDFENNIRKHIQKIISLKITFRKKNEKA